MDNNPPVPVPATLDQRRLKALELRKLGMPYHLIGKALDISTTQAWRDVKTILEERIEQDQRHIAEQRQVELERIEMVLAPLAQKVREGDTAAIDRWLKASDARRRLLGLDADKDQAVAPQIKFLDLSIEKP